MEYKKYIQSKELRLKILMFFKWIPDNLMVRIQYYIKRKKKLNLKNPKLFSEKIQWMKLNYKNPNMKMCVDKFAVRQYVSDKNLDYILVDLYQIYETVDEIDLDRLPKKFVLKTTNGSGTNLIVQNKEDLDLNKEKKEIENWIKGDLFLYGREWAYKNVKPQIIIEEYLEDSSDPSAGINDYKFFCFNGKPEYIIVDVGRFSNHRRNIYDTSWNLLECKISNIPNTDTILNRPEKLNEMLQIATKLSEEFPFARIDLYFLNNQIYFGEITFYPGSGYSKFTPEKYDRIFGEKLDIRIIGE